MLSEIKENTNVKHLYLDGGYYSDKTSELEKEKRNQTTLYQLTLIKTINCRILN
jgi:hypothetical protein